MRVVFIQSIDFFGYDHYRTMIVRNSCWEWLIRNTFLSISFLKKNTINFNSTMLPVKQELLDHFFVYINIVFSKTFLRLISFFRLLHLEFVWRHFLLLKKKKVKNVDKIFLVTFEGSPLHVLKKIMPSHFPRKGRTTMSLQRINKAFLNWIFCLSDCLLFITLMV